MYDAKSEANEFIADSASEAIAKACEFFGVEADALRVSEPAVGQVYGLGSRAVVVAIPKDAPQVQHSRDRGDRGDRGGREERGRGRDDGPRRGRGDDRRGGRDDGGRGRRDRGDRGGEERRPRSEARRGRGDRLEASAPANTGEPLESKAEVSGELGEVGEFVKGLIERMGLGGFEISEVSEGDFLVVELKGHAAEDMGSGDGRAVDAVQLLANQFAMRQDDDAPRVVIDAEGDADRREAFLTRLAERAARRANDTRRSVALDPMNARDRRLVHVALRDSDNVATMSIGSGRYRQVVVVPEGSPEFEEAQRSSKEAAARERDR